jgi:hypothetical protein
MGCVMINFGRLVGFVWASPFTVMGVLYVLPMWALGLYKFLGVKGDALIWNLTPKVPTWFLKRCWFRSEGHVMGNVIVLKHSPETDRGRVTLRHEQEHVRQHMTLGPFMPLLYGIAWMTIKLSCRHSHPYFSNPFEVEARRAAGQIIDVEGAVKRLRAHSQKKDVQSISNIKRN